MEDPYLTAEEKRAFRKLEKEAKSKVASDDAVIQSIMGNFAGRSWMREQLEACHIFSSSFTGDSLSTAFREGERNIGLRLLAGIMSACPQAYIEMMGEQNARHSTLDRCDPDDDRNYDSAGRWIGDGDGPDDE
jgi:hypothetical protein